MVDLPRAPLGKPENGAFAESHLGENGRFAESQGKGLSAKEPRDGQNTQLCREYLFAQSPPEGSRQRLSLPRALLEALGKDYFFLKKIISLPRALLEALGKDNVCLEPSWRLSAKTNFKKKKSLCLEPFWRLSAKTIFA